MVYIFWSCKDKNEARKIIHELLNQQIIACASIFPEVESIYRWEGNIEQTEEVKVILKTINCHFDAVQNVIQAESSYEVSEVVQVDVACGNPQYLSWITDQVRASF